VVEVNTNTPEARVNGAGKETGTNPDPVQGVSSVGNPLATNYYTEYPTGSFVAASDAEALHSKARVIYRESDTADGKPFVILREPTRCPMHGDVICHLCLARGYNW
jgi:hypothetical protein